MSLFKRVQNILEEDRKAYFSSEQTDLYENKFVTNTLQAIRKSPIGKKIEKNVVKGGGKLLKSIKKRFVKTPKTNVNKSNQDYLDNVNKVLKKDSTRNINNKVVNPDVVNPIEKKYTNLNKNKKNDSIDDFINAENPFDVKNNKKKTYTPKKETPKTETPKTETPKTETPKTETEIPLKDRMSQAYDKNKNVIKNKRAFVEPEVKPKVNPKVNPEVNPEVNPKVDTPKTNPFKDFLKKIELGKLTRTAIKTAGGVGAAAIVTNKLLNNTKTQTQLDKIKKQNKKLTSTSNGNNKLIPIDPNNKDAATTTTKKLYPVKLKFGLGSDR